MNKCPSRLLGGDGTASTTGYPLLSPLPAPGIPLELRRQPLPADAEPQEWCGGEIEVSL